MARTATKKAETPGEKQARELDEISRGAYACIVDMTAKLDMVEDDGEPDEAAREEARETIQDDALSVEVRGGWVAPGDAATPEEYQILLSTGGPATRIIGELDANCEPSSATLQSQNWGTLWKSYEFQDGACVDDEPLLAYARCFTFGGF